ncbi:ATP synthase F(0) complex subunit k, mitochondrial-like [Lycorma delicatula]|uniref:ATP synthase F(0) complex subunit k, mitochondrial-like n=1 Tax=Lycorma delicatula TaxID=130591 RepID=UPI003F512B38
MAAPGDIDETQFKGLSKIFNSHTDRGRINFSKLTYAVCAGLALYFYLKPKKK